MRKLSGRIRHAVCALAIGALGGAALVISGCNKNAAGGFAQPPPVVTVAKVEVADVPVYLDEIGHTTASEVVTIVPQVAGKIIKRDFIDGADLKKGQKLFEIDPRPFQASLDAANAALQQAQAQLNNAQTNFRRISSLLVTKAVAQQDYDNAKDAVDVGQANVKAGQAQVETATLNLEYCTITSPIDGRAGQRLVDVGNIVNANQTALLVIEKIAPIYVDFTIPETQLDQVRRDSAAGRLKVIVTNEDDPGHPQTGELTFLDNAVQDGTGTIKLRAIIDNGHRQLWPGQFVRVRLILATLGDARLIPYEAVQIGQTGPYVFVLNSDNKVQQVPITPGQRQGDLIVITRGLSSDQTVIRSGQLNLVSGSAVQIQPQPAGAAPPTAATATTSPSETLRSNGS